MTAPSASGLATRTTSRTEPEAPPAREPTDQVTMPAESAPLPVGDRNVVLTGIVSERTTPVAPDVPVFEEPSVHALHDAVAIWSGASLADTDRTGAEVTVVVMALPLTGAV